MQEVMRLNAEGKLTVHQKKWMADSRPPEELYDVEADPFQLNNLAENPEYRGVLDEMRLQQKRWSEETNDMGLLNESEMIEQMWPGGKQPVTDKPYFVVNAEEDRGLKNYREGGTYTLPMSLSFYCPTQGSSIVYTTEEGDSPRWKLYAGSLRLTEGTHTIRVKAVRYGYRSSEELTGKFTILPRRNP